LREAWFKILIKLYINQTRCITTFTHQDTHWDMTALTPYI